MLYPRATLALALALPALLLACAQPAQYGGDDNVPRRIELDGGRVRFEGMAFPDGRLRIDVDGFAASAAPGETLAWDVDVALEADGAGAILERVEAIQLVTAARRMCDADGHPRDQDGYFASTYLTPSGLPVEGFQYFVASSHVGGPYRTPLDHGQVIPLDTVARDGDRLALSARVEAPLAADTPPGLYRVELALFAAVDGVWFPLHMVGAGGLGGGSACDVDYETLFYTRFFLPPMRVGTMAAEPRAIWTLFTSRTHGGVAGVVADSDAPHFALSTRVKLPGRYRLPCTPDRGACVVPIEPELPQAKFVRFGNAMLEPDFARGHADIAITRPDGGVDDLGRVDFDPDAVAPIDGRWQLNTGVEYTFEQFGRYLVEMTGETWDRYGNRYASGGRYEVWVAHPLTFATGIKPGNPMRVGESYPIAATINPPVPAQVDARVRFFPGTHPDDVLVEQFRGVAGRFGYFYPDPDHVPLTFPEPGEYDVRLLATHTDADGRVFMGELRNASVVMPAGDPGLTVWGSPPQHERLDRDVVGFTLTGEQNSMNIGPREFPYRSGDTLYFTGNGPFVQFINPAMHVRDPSGHLRGVLRRHFPPALVDLDRGDVDRREPWDYWAFPGPTTQIANYVARAHPDDQLPLMSTTTRGYSPFEYPELVDRAGYFYLATSRPGFPAFFVVADSTITESYWFNSYTGYEGTVGAAKRGDQPGDVYWSVVSAQFADRVAGQGLYGTYGSGGVALLRGDDSRYEAPAFEHPVATIHGVELDIYGGVGPAPGLMVETGAVKGVGSIAVPMAPHDASIRVVAPDGGELLCEGRADVIGNFTCPAGKLTFAQAGVYRVEARFREGSATGTCPGARDGWYQVYAVDRDSPYRVLFAPETRAEAVPYDRPLVIAGRVDPAPARAVGYYSVVSPGILIDEGTLDVVDGRFELRVHPQQIGAEFPNLHDHPFREDHSFFPRMLGVRPRLDRATVEDHARVLATGLRDKQLSDLLEITVFVEGTDADGAPLSAGGKLALRGPRVVIPSAFLDGAGDTSPHPGGAAAGHE